MLKINWFKFKISTDLYSQDCWGEHPCAIFQPLGSILCEQKDTIIDDKFEGELLKCPICFLYFNIVLLPQSLAQPQRAIIVLFGSYMVNSSSFLDGNVNLQPFSLILGMTMIFAETMKIKCI